MTRIKTKLTFGILSMVLLTILVFKLIISSNGTPISGPVFGGMIIAGIVITSLIFSSVIHVIFKKASFWKMLFVMTSVTFSVVLVQVI